MVDLWRVGAALQMAAPQLAAEAALPAALAAEPAALPDALAAAAAAGAPGVTGFPSISVGRFELPGDWLQMRCCSRIGGCRLRHLRPAACMLDNVVFVLHTAPASQQGSSMCTCIPSQWYSAAAKPVAPLYKHVHAVVVLAPDPDKRMTCNSTCNTRACSCMIHYALKFTTFRRATGGGCAAACGGATWAAAR